MIRKRFDMSPIEVAKAACMWGMVSPRHVEVLAAVSPMAALNAAAGNSSGGSMASSQGSNKVGLSRSSGRDFALQPH